MRIYLGFDDTDDLDAPMGTGRLVREFGYKLPDGFILQGIVRHQLPRLDTIPFTSNNSSACAIIDMTDDGALDTLRRLAIEHLEIHCAPGSDPGLCLACESDVTQDVVSYGQLVTSRRVTQKDAMRTAGGIDLYGLGGTNDGIIGALAAVGLTKYGWCGRFIEYGTLRDLPANLHVRELTDAGITVVSVDRDPLVPQPDDMVVDANWIRPSLWAGQPMLQLRRVQHGVWETAHGKRKKKHAPGMGKGKAATFAGTAQ
ncbi:hypothetical protein [uncultured Pseudodesulfovibrio sp.]|uniref:hypothetical protein n=1 Tax=uncultured Pseudodesulfovibrio sp. TaxID=2035858 RepID=UPI0029C7CBCD|nr:hypothetical protein [uncultured Pseudodesulfovibrio sp.]